MIDNSRDPNLRDLLSPQEFYLIGGTLCGTPEARFQDEPYTPFAVQKGRDPSVVNFERRDEEVLLVGPWVFKDERGEELPFRGERVQIVLQPLNIMTGETIWDPMPVNRKLRLNTSDPEPYQLRDPKLLLG